MGGRERGEQREDDGLGAGAVSAIVEAQVESARERVFRAYVRARDQAQRLALAELDDAPAPGRGPSD
jgi:hypothetical protein